jgi:hypothetical protein
MLPLGNGNNLGTPLRPLFPRSAAIPFDHGLLIIREIRRLNATTRRTPASGSYRLRRNLLGYCLVRALDLRIRGRCSSSWGRDLGGREP